MKILAVAAAFLALSSAVARADDSILGEWSAPIGEGATLTIVFGEDGSYSMSVDGQHAGNGTFTIEDGDTLVLTNAQDGSQIRYEAGMDAGRLVVSGGDLAAPLTFSRAGGGATGEPAQGGAGAAGPQVGRWVHRSEFLEGWIVLLPDGRYSSVLTAVGVEAPSESGTYTFTGATLTIRSGGNQVTYDVVLSGEEMTISGGNLSMALTYVREAGSADRVAGEAARADAAKDREDDEWRARFPVGPLAGAFQIPALGEIPADPKWSNVFPGATVFTKPQIYVWWGSPEYMYRPGTGKAGRYKCESKWFFQSNGRVYVTSTIYMGSTKPAGENQPFWGLYYIDGENTVAHWGRYRIAADDSFHVELDDTSTIDATFLDGRRNLYWAKGDSRCGNVEWETEALRRQQEGR